MTDPRAPLPIGINSLQTIIEEDAHIHCIFMTGVSKFSKVSLFSGVNQLNDITLSARFATVCGYTQADLPTEKTAASAGAEIAKTDDAPTRNPALAQIQQRGYSAKYRGLACNGLFEVGLVFDSQARNLVQADWIAVDT